MKKRDGRKQLWGGALVGSRQTVVIFPGKKKDRTQRKGDYASQKRVVNTGNPTCNSKCSQCSEVLPTYPRNRRLLTLRKTTRGFAESRGGLQVIGAFVDERAKRSVLWISSRGHYICRTDHQLLELISGLFRISIDQVWNFSLLFVFAVFLQCFYHIQMIRNIEFICTIITKIDTSIIIISYFLISCL